MIFYIYLLVIYLNYLSFLYLLCDFYYNNVHLIDEIIHPINVHACDI